MMKVVNSLEIHPDPGGIDELALTDFDWYEWLKASGYLLNALPIMCDKVSNHENSP